MPPRRFHLGAAAVAALLALLPTPRAGALEIDAASIAFNPKKTDGFAVKGRFAPVDAAGITEVRVELGDFAQTIPLARFAVKKGKLTFKSLKGVPGLASMTLDTVKGKFAASAKNLTLSPFPNPAAFRLAAGSALDECTTLTFAESKTKRKLARVVPACGFDGTPEIEPATVFAGTPTDVRVRVAVVDDLALDPGSLALFRLDAALDPTGAPLCTLHDDGSPAHGDAVAVDGVFGCRFVTTETIPGRARFAVQALRDTVLVLSPSVPLDTVTPLVDSEIATVLATQDAASDLWEAKLAELGDLKKARKATVAAILELPGVASAAVGGDGASITITYASGLRGGLDLDPLAAEGFPDVAAAAVLAPPALAPSQEPTRPRRTATAPRAVEVSEQAPRVGNNKVLIWSAFENEHPTMGKTTADLVQLFQTASCPTFDVTVLKNEECTLATLATFQDYGTVVMLTHGAQPQRDGDVAFMSREKATLYSEWYGRATALKLGHLLVYKGRFAQKHGYFVFFPSFLGTQFTRTFPNSIVFAGGCTSAGNRTMSSRFLAYGAQAYVGLSGTVHGAFLGYAGTEFFRGLVTGAKSAADAFAGVEHKSAKDLLAGSALVQGLDPDVQQTLASRLTLLVGDGRVAYPCQGAGPGLVETITVPAAAMAHGVGNVVLQSGAKYRLVITGTLHNQSGASFSDYDGIYCFDSSSGFCKPGSPFPNVDAVYFYSQSAGEEPGFGSLENALEFTGAGLPPYDAGHRYELPYTGENGKLWVAVWPQMFPDVGIDFTGSISVQIYRD